VRLLSFYVWFKRRLRESWVVVIHFGVVAEG
jgi:hypothetical protein